MIGRKKQHHGFTIVELLIVIAIIGILAGITIVSYGSWKRHNDTSVVKSDLHQAAAAMESARTFDNAYPTTLPTTLTASRDVNLSITLPSSTWPHYSNLSDVQNGVLLAQICRDMIDEGLGNGLNAGGQTDPYISNCGNWNHDSMQFTAWNTKVFKTPVSSTAFTDYAASVPAGDAWHPNQQSTIRAFYTALNIRFLAQGGTYPITSFYDSWATPSNGGVALQDLPSADPVKTTSDTYCIQATHADFSDLVWHILPNSDPVQGSC